MKKLIILIGTMIMFSGCSMTTLELMYSDARVVYQDARYVVHEYQEIKRSEQGK